MYVIQASPLTKLFMRKYQDKCAENLEFVKDETPFDIEIPRAFGAVRFVHMVPMHVSKILPKQPNRKSDEFSIDELIQTVEWLTGGKEGDRSEETDIYGVVHLGVDLDVGSALVDIAGLQERGTEESARKTFKDLQTTLMDKTRKAMKDARALADHRVLRAMKATHSNLRKQYEVLRTEGKGVYTPSVCEAVGAFILQQEIGKLDERAQKMRDLVKDSMAETTILSK